MNITTLAPHIYTQACKAGPRSPARRARAPAQPQEPHPQLLQSCESPAFEPLHLPSPAPACNSPMNHIELHPYTFPVMYFKSRIKASILLVGTYWHPTLPFDRQPSIHQRTGGACCMSVCIYSLLLLPPTGLQGGCEWLVCILALA